MIRDRKLPGNLFLPPHVKGTRCQSRRHPILAGANTPAPRGTTFVSNPLGPPRLLRQLLKKFGFSTERIVAVAKSQIGPTPSSGLERREHGQSLRSEG